MPNLGEHISNLFKFVEVNAQDDKSEKTGRRASGTWPRRMSFNPSPQPCTEEDDPGESETCSFDDDEEEDEDFGCENSTRSPSFLARKLHCMFHAAKYGLKEGALAGVFFGGGWGIYKYVDGVFINPSGDGKKRGSQDTQGSAGASGESTVNTNIIFVSACNSAIVLGIMCTVFCCLKAVIYCN